MKVWWMIGAVGMVFVLISCGVQESKSEEHHTNEETSEEPPPEMTGYVMDQDKDRLLVVAPMDPEVAQEGRAMWVSGVSEDLWIGKHVEVWIDGGIDESFPEQAKAKKISVLEMSEVEGADLNAAEALSTALSDTKTEDVLAVELIVFDEESDQWTVKLHKQGSNSEEIKKVVKDEK